jgi:hypothetical protein
MARSRSEWTQIGFLLVWMVFSTAALFTAFWYMGAAALGGEAGAAIFLMVWLGAAGFGLWNAGRQLVRLLLVGRAPPRPMRNQSWDDGIDPPSQ